MWSVAAWVSYGQLVSRLGAFPSVPAFVGRARASSCSCALQQTAGSLPQSPWGQGLRGSRVSPKRFAQEAVEGPLGSCQQSVGGTHKQNKLPSLPFSSMIFLTHVLHHSCWWSGKDESRIVCQCLQQELETAVSVVTLFSLLFFHSAQESLSVERQRKSHF